MKLWIFTLAFIAYSPSAFSNILIEAQNRPISTATSTTLSAENLLRRMMVKKGWRVGWDEKKKRFIALNLSECKSVNPSSDVNFLIKRGIQSKIAVMNTKASIIEFINTKMSVEEKLDIPGTSIASLYGEQFSNYEKKIIGYSRKISKIIQPINSTLSETLLLSTTPSVLNTAVLNIKGLDKSSLSTKRKILVDKYTKRVLDAYIGWSQLRKKALASPKKSNVNQVFTSTVSTLAHQQLNGATVITQAES